MALADQGRARPRGVVEVEPVREFVGDHHRLALTLHQQLIKARAETAASIITGAPKDFPEYRNRVGVVEGLDIAIALCEQSQRQL